MKDFYDVWILSRSYAFEDDRLNRAIAETFERRDTAIPLEAPMALTQAFALTSGKQRQWVPSFTIWPSTSRLLRRW